MKNKTTLVALFAAGLFGLAAINAQAKSVEGIVNVNTASVQELSLLPGVGPAKAEEIIQLRKTKPFAQLEDLKAVKGLGAKRLEALKPHISFSGATNAKSVATPKTANGAGVAKPAASPGATAPTAAVGTPKMP